MHLLDNIRIILVATSHPGNIGATARAMKTMGLKHLRLVNPKLFPHADASARAAGADDLLQMAEIFPMLSEALSDCSLILGTTARDRYLTWPTLAVRSAAREALNHAAAAPVAILFGSERTGLTNVELESCHLLLRIPTAGDYSSLNLGAAVQIVAYELFIAAQNPIPALPTHIPAPALDMEHFYTHIERVLSAIGFLDPAHPRLLRRRIRRLFQRAQPDALEVSLLRGILTAIQRLPKK